MRARGWRIFVLVILAFAFTTWAGGGGDPWKAKPYQQWDEKDIQKIVTDSPWSKMVRVSAPWLGGATAANTGEAELRMGQPGVTRNAPEVREGSTADAHGRQVNFFVRWISSRTLREAAARNDILAGHLKQQEAEQQLAKVPDVFQVFVAGPDMTPFQKMDDAALKASATLSLKKSKQRITAGAVQVNHTPDGKVQSIVFAFPRRADSGEATIGTGEKSLDLSIVLENRVRIDVNFDLSKMEDNAGRDL